MKTFRNYINEDITGIQMRIIMLGGPGSGKSTYSKFITKHFMISHACLHR